MIKYFFKKIYLFLFFQISYHLQKSTKLKQIKEIIALIFLKGLLFIYPLKRFKKFNGTSFFSISKKIYTLIYKIFLIICINFLTLFLKIKDICIILYISCFPLFFSLFIFQHNQKILIKLTSFPTSSMFPNMTNTLETTFLLFHINLPTYMTDFLINFFIPIYGLLSLPLLMQTIYYNPFGNEGIEYSYIETTLIFFFKIYSKNFLENQTEEELTQLIKLDKTHDLAVFSLFIPLISWYYVLTQPLILQNFRGSTLLPKRNNEFGTNSLIDFYFMLFNDHYKPHFRHNVHKQILPTPKVLPDLTYQYTDRDLNIAILEGDDEQAMTDINFDNIKRLIHFDKSISRLFSHYKLYEFDRFFYFEKLSQHFIKKKERSHFALNFSPLYNYYLKPLSFYFYNNVISLQIITFISTFLVFILLCNYIFYHTYSQTITKLYYQNRSYTTYRPYLDQYIYSWYRLMNYTPRTKKIKTFDHLYSQYLDFFFFYPNAHVKQQSITEKIFTSYLLIPTSGFFHLNSLDTKEKLPKIKQFHPYKPVTTFSYQFIFILFIFFNEFLSNNPFFLGSTGLNLNFFSLQWITQPNFYIKQYPWLLQTNQLCNFTDYFSWPSWNLILPQPSPKIYFSNNQIENAFNNVLQYTTQNNWIEYNYIYKYENILNRSEPLNLPDWTKIAEDKNSKAKLSDVFQEMELNYIQFGPQTIINTADYHIQQNLESYLENQLFTQKNLSHERNQKNHDTFIQTTNHIWKQVFNLSYKKD